MLFSKEEPFFFYQKLTFPILRLPFFLFKKLYRSKNIQLPNLTFCTSLRSWRELAERTKLNQERIYVTFGKKGKTHVEGREPWGCNGAKWRGTLADRARGWLTMDMCNLTCWPQRPWRGAWGRNVFGVKIIQFTHNRGGGRDFAGDARIQMTCARGGCGVKMQRREDWGRKDRPMHNSRAESIDTPSPSIVHEYRNKRDSGHLWRFSLVHGVF